MLSYNLTSLINSKFYTHDITLFICEIILLILKTSQQLLV